MSYESEQYDPPLPDPHPQGGSMKSAEEILRAISTLCPKFPDPACRGICICKADLAAIRAAQIEAAEWMREEAQEAIRNTWEPGASLMSINDAIRAIKLPGETI